MDAKFIDPRSKEEVEHPSDPKASVAMVINCRCTFAPKIGRASCRERVLRLV